MMDHNRVLANKLCMIGDKTTFTAWNRSALKRGFDLALASILLVLTSPVLLAVAVFVKLTSEGPILFRHCRMGKQGRTFELLKFRTMTSGSNKAELQLTRAGDARIVPAARVLRKWKLDELPQLYNVVRGDMSLVGPRPDVSHYFANLNEIQRHILTLRPGITGAASLHYRNEEQLLATVPTDQLEQFYCTQLFPHKIRLDLDYACRASFWSDLGMLLRTALAVLK